MSISSPTKLRPQFLTDDQIRTFLDNENQQDDSFTCNTPNKCRTAEQSSFNNKGHSFINIICLHCGEALAVPVYCGNRFCPVCSKPRLARVRDRLSFLIKRRPNEKGSMLKHLTLTVRSHHNLPEMVSFILNSFRKLRQRKYVSTRITGGAFVIEVTHSSEGWHAHIHAVMQSQRIDWEKLRDIWKEITSGSTGVFIQNIPPHQAVKYLSKYISKPPTGTSLDEDANKALKGKRLFQVFGNWYKINLKYIRSPTPCINCGTPSSYYPTDIFYTEIENARSP